MLYQLGTRLLALGLLFTAARAGAAIPSDLSLSQIQHTEWTAKQGAPADIWALAQSPDGFLLLGTGSGLYRFDGLNFERVIPSNQPDLAFRDITALLALPSGDVWIGYYAGGVSELKNGQLTNYGRSEGVPSGWITSFAREPDGTLWVAAREGLGRFSDGHWEMVSSDWNFRGHGADWVLLDQQGTLWVAGGETVQFLPRGAHRFDDTGIRSGYNASFALAPDGTVWLGGESVSPRPLKSQRSVPTTDESAGKLHPVKRLLVDHDGSIWATDALHGGIYRATRRGADAAAPTPHAPVETFGEAEGLTSGLAVPLLEDREGNIWVGTNLGLNRFRATPFVRESRIPLSRRGYSLATAPDGSVWIASNEQLYEVRGSRCDLIARLPSPIRSAYQEPGGALWLGTHESLVEVVDDKPTYLALPAPARPARYQYVHAITSAPSRGLWVSAIDRGLLRVNNHRWAPSDSEFNLPEATPTALWTDAARGTWFGYGDGTAALRSGDKTQVFGAEQGLRIGPIMVIRGSNGEIFFGGESGLARFDGRQLQSLSASRADALSGISGIIVRESGDIWLNGNRGVVHVSSDAIKDVFHHPLARLHYDLFDVQDGLPGYAQQGEDASAVAGADGRLWFATNHGIVWTDPDHPLTNGIPPNVVIRDVLANQRSFNGSDQIELAEGTQSVRIDYTAISLTAPERIHFRYRLDGAEDTWRDAGNERSVRYANLRPGHYIFRVIASNSDGVWNDAGAAVSFTLHPAIYQTPWFLVVASAAFLGMCWLLLLARLRHVTHRERKRLEQRMEDRFGERTRVARELHDTLLQSLQGLLLRFQVAYELLPGRPMEAKYDLGSAIDRTVDAITEGRNAVQGLRTGVVEGDDLAAAIKAVAEELASDHYGKQVVFRVELQGAARPLQPTVRDEIYQIAAESLRNARSHAQASTIEVELRYDERQLRLRVRDNGKGIESRFLNEDGATGHYGLSGMRERTTLLGGTMSIWTAPGAGTEIELTLPAASVYAAMPSKRLSRLLRRLSGKIAELEHE